MYYRSNYNNNIYDNEYEDEYVIGAYVNGGPLGPDISGIVLFEQIGRAHV